MRDFVFAPSVRWAEFSVLRGRVREWASERKRETRIVPVAYQASKHTLKCLRASSQKLHLTRKWRPRHLPFLQHYQHCKTTGLNPLQDKLPESPKFLFLYIWTQILWRLACQWCKAQLHHALPPSPPSPPPPSFILSSLVLQHQEKGWIWPEAILQPAGNRQSGVLDRCKNP